MQAPALRAVRCSACSLTALRLFLGNSVETRIPHATRRFAPIATTSKFSTLRNTPRLLQAPSIEETRIPGDQKELAENEKGSEESADITNAAEEAPSDVPWYLQVEPPRHPTLIHEPPPLPDIPEGAPKLFEPLLKYVSDELGLDDLTLLDLREMDPPPAMGPDVIMVFGTARSERHLHVSADRLVRWLRGRGISAKADGLLGRNQLKTKLKRIARKAKMMGTSGVPRGGDDGISTGWICVNLGTVGGSSQEAEMMLDEEGRPTGFGVPQLGTTIVVQMMTEGRREDLDLETLWENLLKKNIEQNELLASGQIPKSRFAAATPIEHARTAKSRKGNLY
ncbi:ATPase synthesis protein 25, mitochondrial [Podospora fimiseda]|uniref:ATPase synthesis protein 25 n=1 Tax=Podospora fimiseda TaxID=252190 RepID=A0AAN7BPN9_9PEZI|nr:ATPase synthesis protein 25, mitochondrial [Podospora fimiseda]